MLPPVFATLSAAAPVTALVGTNPCRVYPYGFAGEAPTYPYVTWSIISGAPDNLLSERPPIDAMSVQIDIWAKTDASARALAIAVRDAFELTAHITRFGSTERDRETESYRYSMDVDFWVHR